MKRFFSTIDDLLRGNLTRREDLAAGRIDIPVRTLVVAGVLLGATYGVTMGLFAGLRSENPSFAQLLVTTAKVPLLFLLTLVVTYPSLYVVSAMFDSKLEHAQTLRLLLAAMTANLALLASLGPVMAFFTFCTDSYAFMVVLNVLFFALAGLVGLGFLRRALESVFEAPASQRPPAAASSAAGGEQAGDGVDDRTADRSGDQRPSADEFGWTAGSSAESGANVPSQHEIRRGLPRSPAPQVDPRARAGQRVFTLWIVIYAVVGAQMGWILRPFIGAPDLPFELFRSERDSNFFAAVMKALGTLFQ
ncbi:hypothetical protein [Planctomycetes bacterium Pla163]|uniref:hypothetical protein n=1 Tax=Rohdeia mirabilis TaxID=2528008 RepID=UPI00119CDB91